MAVSKVSIADGNWSTAGTWGTVSNTPTLHASTNITLAATDKLSATFTAPTPDTVKASLGCVFYIAAWGTATTITVALQEDSGAGFADVATKVITKASLNSAYNTGWVFAKWASAYVYTVATADKYRYAFRRDAGTTTTLAADSGGSLVSFIDVSNVSAAPTSSEDVFIIGANETGTVSVILDSTQTCGSATASTSYSTRILTNALMITRGGTLTWATTASIDLNVKGVLYVLAGGTINIGSTSSPISAAYTDRIIFNLTANTYSFYVGDYGKCVMQGSPVYTIPTTTELATATAGTFKGTYSSGTGTVIDPMIITALKTLSGVTMTIASPCVVTYANHGLCTDTPIMLTTDGALPTGLSVNTQYYVKKIDDNTFNLASTAGGTSIDTSGTQSGTHTLNVNWVVNDEVAVVGITRPAVGSYTEYKFIKTVNSATSYVLSDTAGGAASALVRTHTNAPILNLKRNVQITTNSTTYSTCAYFLTQTVSGNVDIDWASFYMLGAVSGREASCAISNYVNIDYSVSYSGNNTNAINARGFSFGYTVSGSEGIPSETIRNGLIAARFSGGTGYGLFLWGANLQTFNHCYAVGNYLPGLYLTPQTTTAAVTGSCSTNTFNYCQILDNTSFYSGKGNWSNVTLLNGSVNNLFSYCSIAVSKESGVGFMSCSDNRFENCSIGVLGENLNSDINTYPGTYCDDSFYNCTFGSTTLVNATYYPQMVKGSKIRIFQHNATANKHFVYSPEGVFTSTGSGLTDTTVRTAGGYGIRYAPIVYSSPYQYWDFKVPTGNIQNKTMVVGIWCKINNAAYYATNYQLPRLTIFYDNTTTAYCQASASTDWQLLAVPFTPTTTWPEIKVTVSAGTDATSTNAYVYFDDISIMYPSGTTVNLGTMDYFSGDTALPVTPPIATALGAADVWTASSTVDWGASTMGKHVAKKLLKFSTFMGTK